MEPWRANQTIAENRVRIGLIALATRWKLTKNPDYGRMMMGDLECGPGRAMWESSFKYERAFPPSFTMYLFTYQSRTHIHFATFSLSESSPSAGGKHANNILVASLELEPEQPHKEVQSVTIRSNFSTPAPFAECVLPPPPTPDILLAPSPLLPSLSLRPIRCRSATAAPCEHSSLLPRRASPTECSLIEGKEEERRKHQP